HVKYFEKEIRPRLDSHRKFRGPAGLERKRRLLTGARCPLVPSLVEETNSLAGVQATACGTPVVAYAAGALPEIVEHGRTGFIVRDADEMTAVPRRIGEIDHGEWRGVAHERFSSDRMARDYISLYERMLTAD